MTDQENQDQEIELQDDETILEMDDHEAKSVASADKAADASGSAPKRSTAGGAADASKQDPMPKTKSALMAAMHGMMMKKDKKTLQAMYHGMNKEMMHMNKEDLDFEEDAPMHEIAYEADFQEDLNALVSEEATLSDEFKAKAETIFEAAIKAKVKEESQRLQGEYETKLAEDTETHKAELVEKVDSYLNYVVEEWMQENKIAIERGIKGEIAEDFIGGLKKLFEDHYIDVPDEKYNVLEDQASKIEDLEKKLNEEIQKNVDLNKSNGELKKEEIIAKSSEDLTDVQKEKFNKLAEEVEYSNEEDFTSKVKTIKESYFGAKEEAKSNDIDDVAVGDGSEQVDPADLTNSMAAYTAAISKTKDIKLSNK